MKSFDLIIFDWDGTLVNSIDWIVHCLQKSAQACGCDVPETQAAKNIIGLSFEHAMAELFPGIDKHTQEQLIAHYSQQFFSKKITQNDLFAGVYEMLVQFKQNGYLLAVATGKKSTGLVKAINGTGLVDFFSATRSADQTASKPDPLMINEIVEELSVSKDKVLMVGDSVHDLQMAVNAKVTSIGVACGAHSVEVLRQYNPMMCLQRTSELLEII